VVKHKINAEEINQDLAKISEITEKRHPCGPKGVEGPT